MRLKEGGTPFCDGFEGESSVIFTIFWKKVGKDNWRGRLICEILAVKLSSPLFVIDEVLEVVGDGVACKESHPDRDCGGRSDPAVAD